jgi:peptidase M48-like protein
VSKRIVCAAWIVLTLIVLAGVSPAASKVKIRGYVTARPDADTLLILDDVIHLSASTHFDLQNSSAAGAMPLTLSELSPGVLIEAEGTWTGRHQFDAEKISCDAAQFDRQIHGDAILQTEPADANSIMGNQPGRLKADGEVLLINEETKRNWKREDSAPSQQAASQPEASPRFVGDEVKYTGVRGADGNVAVEHIELGVRPPASAYRIPGDRKIIRAHDPQTKIDVLEIRKGDKLEGRLKLFDVPEVQDYVRELGVKLLPPAADVTARALEFRFYVVEDPSINAAALPDGTVLVNTGLLGAVENESELAFVLSHEIAHVLQAHHWREANDTRAARVMIIIGAVAASGFIRDVGLFLGEIGLEAVVNGYSRKIENQADRLGMQNIIDLGYDPRSAVQFFHTMVEKYGRTSSVIWSNHDSNLLRGSFLTVQLARQYPKGQFDHAIVDTDSFKNMKEIMGPVKIM